MSPIIVQQLVIMYSQACIVLAQPQETITMNVLLIHAIPVHQLREGSSTRCAWLEASQGKWRP